MRLLPVFLLLALPVFAQRSDTTITLKAIAGLQYDQPRLAVRPGTRVTLLLENYDDMAHNVVVTQPGARLEVVNLALKVPAEKNYVPDTPLVLAATPVVIPGATARISFTLEKEGIYPYVCTYPGHGFVMFGALYATTKPLPPLDRDPNLPPTVKQPAAAHAGHSVGRPSPHPFPVEYPVLYRTFIAGSSPAAIVVSVSPTLSYCWDAGQCRLRFAWAGSLDMDPQWDGKGNKLSKVVGETFWREDSLNYPIRVGDAGVRPAVKFLGYRLLGRLPQFRFAVDGVEITETIRALPGETGLVREFSTIRFLGKPLFFSVKPAPGIRYESSAGAFRNGILKVPSGTVRFSVTMHKTTPPNASLRGAKTGATKQSPGR
jgi:azurin